MFFFLLFCIRGLVLGVYGVKGSVYVFFIYGVLKYLYGEFARGHSSSL